MTQHRNHRAHGQDVTIADGKGFLWVGCSDLSVIPFESSPDRSEFLHINLGNLALSSDMSFLATLKMAVETDDVGEIIICGHYGCRASEAAASGIRKEILGDWLVPIRLLSRKQAALEAISGSSRSVGDALAELNVAEQAKNVSRMSILRDAWERGRDIVIRAVIFDAVEGRLRTVGDSISPAAYP